tara:strand:+ start:1721 stop:2557 length:837 start_codon:yes stop_codon:yes gene_type:complete
MSSYSDDGLVLSRKQMNKFEPLIDVDRLKRDYLFGIEIKDKQGKELPQEAFQTYINNAVSMLEHWLDISITPVDDFFEDRDYHLNDYADWGYMYLNNYPVRDIKKLEMIYFRDEDGEPITVQEIPKSWIRLQRHDGIVRLIPNNKFPANLQIGQAGAFFPEVLRSANVPHLWRVTYDYGFEDGKIPNIINSAVAMIAASQALTIGGNLVLGAGIAGSSISLDALSQSIQTTQSAENSAYSATIKEYGDQLFGKTKDDPFALLKILKNYYKAAEEVNLI